MYLYSLNDCGSNTLYGLLYVHIYIPEENFFFSLDANRYPNECHKGLDLLKIDKIEVQQLFTFMILFFVYLKYSTTLLYTLGRFYKKKKIIKRKITSIRARRQNMLNSN